MLKTMRNSAASSDESGRVLAALRAGIDPDKLIRELAAQHSGDAGFARRLVDLSLTDARAYAVEILWAVQHPIDARNAHPIPTPKEARYAAA